MHRYSNIKKHLCIGLTALSLVACGGGGGSDGNNGGSNDADSNATVTITAPTKVQFKITVEESGIEHYLLEWQKPKDVAEFVVYTAQSDLTGKTAQELEALTSDSDPKKQTTKTNLVAGKASHIFKNLNNKGDTRYAVVMSVVNGKTSKPALPTDTLFVTKGERFYTMRDNQDKCVVDIKNNLIWELKQASGLHGKDYRYTWYNSSLAADKQGTASTPADATCATKGRCDTEKFVADVNKETWCGFNDWRMPTGKGGKGDNKFNELASLFDRSRPSGKPKINALFKNTEADEYWSSSPYAGSNGSAWSENFEEGNPKYSSKDTTYRLRLVRAR